MATQFLKEDFLLQSSLAQRLYQDYAVNLPVIDYHSHLPPGEVLEDRNFENISAIWLHGDHYKWRAMRVLGIEEKYITGAATDRDKFQKWAEAVPHTLRNPLFHWTHMELKNPFGIQELLNGSNAQRIYDRTQEQLAEPGFSTQSLLTHFNVEMVGTTDDPIDDLAAHIALGKTSSFNTKILPSFRPDKSLQLDGGDVYREYIQKLSAVAQINIDDIDSLLLALESRIDFFHAVGGRLSDHGLSWIPLQGNTGLEEINRVFKGVLNGNDQEVTPVLKDGFGFYVLSHLARKYYKLGWVQQFHIGALRNNNHRLLTTLGPDTGFDSIGDFQHATALTQFLDNLERTDELPKTILYNLNPSDSAVFASMTGNFQGEGFRGKIQYGSAWWFLDQLDGMKQQIDTLSNIGLISCFVGMLTDSRSFLSYSRHEYFRRLICDMFANDIQRGVMPNDLEWVGKMVSNICYYNAKEYFNL
ncbi:glucuronate isomerase [Sphingobacterium sp. SYP-B4668]|uniref:glucuronate isomerase n=1 Tax=Sphingobacterium sp. SYP-B4668 TaxID=2996035 RepID=UPI0022DE1322|nr:glucuronate isomerase [Sphingobacterium sp. SYP-B4668]